MSKISNNVNHNINTNQNEQSMQNASPVTTMKGQAYPWFNLLKNRLMGELTETGIRILFVYFSILSILEVLAYLYRGIFSVIASRCFVITGIVCLAITMAYFIHAIWQDIKDRNIFSLITVCSLIIILFKFIGNVQLSDINPDATQQAAAGLDSLKISDFNYTGKAFLGYPNRQYLIAALPAILFGRSITTLHLGFGMPFLLGIMLLYSALRQWTKKLNLYTGLAVLPLYAMFVFPFVTEYYMNFEQAIYPISFTMLAIGFFLLLLCRPSYSSILGLSFIGCLFSNSYTPVLASLGLLLVFLGMSVFGWYQKPEWMPFPVTKAGLAAKSVLMILMNVLIFLFATFLGERQDRITELRSKINIWKVAGQSILDFLTDKNAVFFGMFGVIVIIYLLASLTLCLKFSDFLIALWVLGVFAVSFLLTGYTSYEPAWIMQRALIVIPVLVVAIALNVFDFASGNKIKLQQGVAIIIVISFAFIGVHNFKQVNQSFVYFNYIQPMKYMWKDLEHSVKAQDLEATSEFNLVLYTDNALMKNPADYCKFFFPNAKVYVPEQGVYPSDLNPSLTTFLYGDKGLPNTVSIRSEMLSFEDNKHDLTINWVRGEIAGTN